MKHTFFFIAFLSTVMLISQGCKKDKFTTDNNAKLAFSNDSIVFDTVFTSIGSTTEILKVYNHNSESVIISDIKLLGGNTSKYRINVDGIPGTDFTEVELGGKDSMFVFVEVTVDPDADQTYPFIEDRLTFNTNGNYQEVKLIAWGWNAKFYYPDNFPVNGLPNFTRIAENPHANVTWNAQEPVVVYGYLVVDSTQTLTIEEGTQVFFHEGGGLWVYRGGNIQVNGTVDKPVVFQGDRLESYFDELPGQWDRIWIHEGSENNVFKNVVIKNNFIGIQAETAPFVYNVFAPLSSNSLVLENVKIRNNSFASLYAKNYRVKAQKLELSNAGSHLLAVLGSAKLEFDNCTFANNWGAAIRQTPSVYISNYYEAPQGTQQTRPIEESRFRNCIFWGYNSNEFELDFDENAGVPLDLTFEYSIIKGEEEVINNYIEYFSGEIYVNEDPDFIDFAGGNFGLRENAFPINKGISIPGIDEDINGRFYDEPTIGAHAYFIE